MTRTRAQNSIASTKEIFSVVVPIGAPDTLGLAVNTSDGKVYVVEDAHKLYPKVYKDRFDGLRLQVSGTVLKSDFH